MTSVLILSTAKRFGLLEVKHRAGISLNNACEVKRDRVVGALRDMFCFTRNAS